MMGLQRDVINSSLLDVKSPGNGLTFEIQIISSKF